MYSTVPNFMFAQNKNSAEFFLNAFSSMRGRELHQISDVLMLSSIYFHKVLLFSFFSMQFGYLSLYDRNCLNVCESN